MPHLATPWLRFIVLTALLCAPLAGCQRPATAVETRQQHADAEHELAQARISVPDEPLTLGAAIDFALEYNLDLWIATREQELQKELATQSLLRMLPNLMFNLESSRRSHVDAASSRSLSSGEETLEPSFSSEKDIRNYDISATWSLLDFGVSYFRARQQSQRVAIAAARHERLRQNLTLEVTRAYWQAVAARAAASDAEGIAGDVQVGLDKIRSEIDSQTISRIDGLKRQAALLEQLEELQRYRRAYRSARAELARLIGLSPACDFELAPVDFGVPVPEQSYDVVACEREALARRPELYEKDAEEAISRDEAHIAIARMFPNPSFFWQYNDDDNRYLAFNYWHTAGLRVSWNLLALPENLLQHEAMNLQTELIGQRRLALAIAVLTQLHLALIDYQEALDQLCLTRDIAESRQTLLHAIEDAAREGSSHSGEVLTHRLKHLKARARFVSSVANVRIARARIVNTMGHVVRPHSEEPLATPRASQFDARPCGPTGHECGPTTPTES